MRRVAIVGGGLAGLTAAYDLEQARRGGAVLDWYLFEASGRLGGTVSTTRVHGPDGEYVLEDGPDGWLTEKPAARQFAQELGLGADLLPCNETGKRTYVDLESQLTPLPARMRMMVPEDLEALEDSPLFTDTARAAYRRELEHADVLRASAPAVDESVASFVHRHFGDEVLRKVASPLLSGVFGGDVQRLSVQAVMPTFVALEREHGSLIAGLQAKAAERGDRTVQPTFTSLRRGMGSLPEAIVAALPPEHLLLGNRAAGLRHTSAGWLVRFTGSGTSGCAMGWVPFDELILATPIDTTRELLSDVDLAMASLIPTEASSATLATLCWPAATATEVRLPPGFGFLVPPSPVIDRPQLLAGTFVDQKYSDRAPAGARVLRAFFGELGSAYLAGASDELVADTALAELRAKLGPLPLPDARLTTVRRWPRSLPQYEVGHLQRMARLDERVKQTGRLHLLGNGFRGVGVPDLIRDARAAVVHLLGSLN